MLLKTVVFKMSWTPEDTMLLLLYFQLYMACIVFVAYIDNKMISYHVT